jgi:hypothetical protein
MFRASVQCRLTAIVALSAVVACGEASTVAPQRTLAVSPASLSRGLAGTAAPKAYAWGNVDFRPTSCMSRPASVNSGVFGPAGGVLLFGDSRLIIPGGALRDTVTITATTRGDSTSRVEFEPQGLQFEKSAGLLLGTTGCALTGGSAPNVVYLSPTGEVLEWIASFYDPHWKTIAAPIDHFSGYAIAF